MAEAPVFWMADPEADAIKSPFVRQPHYNDLQNRVRELESLLNQPEVMNFLEGTRLEAAHQVQRWGTVHDRAKEPQDWFWLIGYLAGKALAAHTKGDRDKALHHTISSAAALANWHAHIKLGGGLMTPGSSDIQRMVEDTFGLGESDADSANQPRNG